jgi:hypothetical protein
MADRSRRGLPLAGLIVLLALHNAAVLCALADEVAVSAAQIASVQQATGSARLDVAQQLGVVGKLASINGLGEALASSILATQQDLQVSSNGRFYYSCFKGDAANVSAAAHQHAEVKAANAVGPAGGDDPSADRAFLLHSRPSSTKKIYLDFTGCDLSKCLRLSGECSLSDVHVLIGPDA